ncbi:MAG TPA: EAL domain-containing protein [Thiolapillus brandeum]|uniref:cyclic-guanylate-specific phosphodiesterase n=1 Tax=Thiolapillus brandeum TaxID=1076588 RepID=A0A831WCQ5_9GAMM|nr:EAL domain-containing protein [Thiolapillus brandeum]
MKETDRLRHLAQAGNLEQLYYRERRLSAILRLVSDVNQVLLHARTLEELLRKSCERITRHDDYPVAWVGLTSPGDSRLHVAFQSDRCDPPYLSSGFRVSLEPGSPDAGGPAGRCILEDHSILIENTQSDPTFAPWKERARLSGIHSVLGLPLKAAVDAPFGCLVVYTDNPDGFSRDEAHILQDVADSIGRAVHLSREQKQRQRAEQRIRDSEQRFKQLIDALPNIAVQGYDQEHKVIYWNRSSEVLYGYTRQEATGQRIEDLIIPQPMREGVSQAIDAWMQEGVPVPPGELELQGKDGRKVPVYSSHVLLRGEGDRLEMFCVDIDLSEQKRIQQQLQHLATIDLLTGLPNRVLMNQELQHRIKEASRYKHRLAILFIDIDNFKMINDSLGHEQGDELLRMAASRMGARLREYEMLARFGGDEFVLILPRVDETSAVKTVAEKIIDTFSKPFRLDGQEIYVTSSVGIALYPDDGENKTNLLKNADMAMYRAKENGRNCSRFYKQSMNDELHHRQKLENQLHQALRQGEFELHYQPQVQLDAGAVTSCEALIRWNSPSLGAVPPQDFLPIAERSELINRIGEWVIEEACRQRQAWLDLGIDIRIDINLSGRQFFNHDIFTLIENTLQRYGQDHGGLGIELTEQVLIEASDSTLKGLERLHRRGTKISLDDFGTGYSSLSYLKRFPVDVLKIDREFISGAPNDRNDRSIMEAIIAVGHALGLEVLAEGVETRQQADLARELGCDIGQGYLFQKPVPATELLRKEKGAWILDCECHLHVPETPDNLQ